MVRPGSERRVRPRAASQRPQESLKQTGEICGQKCPNSSGHCQHSDSLGFQSSDVNRIRKSRIQFMVQTCKAQMQILLPETS